MTKTGKLFALAALIVATGVTAADAGTVFPSDQASYARWRVDAAFDVVAQLPTPVAFSLPMAEKGDLAVPLGCQTLSGDSQAECMDVAYEPASEQSVVVETRIGSTSTLERLDAMTVAGMVLQPREQSE